MRIGMKSWIEQRRRSETTMELYKAHSREGRVEKRVWGGRMKGSKNCRRRNSNLVKDYIDTDDMAPKFPTESFTADLEY